MWGQSRRKGGDATPFLWGPSTLIQEDEDDGRNQAPNRGNDDSHLCRLPRPAEADGKEAAVEHEVIEEKAKDGGAECCSRSSRSTKLRLWEHGGGSYRGTANRGGFLAEQDEDPMSALLDPVRGV